MAAVLVIATSLSFSSCATGNNALVAGQRQGYMLGNKSELPMNRGKFKQTRRPRAHAQHSKKTGNHRYSR